MLTFSHGEEIFMYKISCFLAGGNISLSGFSQDGRGMEQMPARQGPEETRECQGRSTWQGWVGRRSNRYAAISSHTCKVQVCGS